MFWNISSFEEINSIEYEIYRKNVKYKKKVFHIIIDFYSNGVMNAEKWQEIFYNIKASFG